MLKILLLAKPDWLVLTGLPLVATAHKSWPKGPSGSVR